MDENTKHIVASNLTVAYCSTVIPKHGPGGGMPTTADTEMSYEEILRIYRRFVASLESQEKLSGR